MKNKLAAFFAAGIVFASGCSQTAPPPRARIPSPAPVAEADMIRRIGFSLSVPTPTPTPVPDVVMVKLLDMNELKRQIETEIASADGTWSVYIKDMAAGDEFVINDAPMKAASVMKLFVMGAAFEDVNDGIFEYSDIESDMYYMITESSNESANALLSALGNGSYAEGIKKVNNFASKYGYNEKTVEYNGFDNPDTVVGGGFNVTSAHDCGMLLDSIYNGTCISAETSEKMLSLLKEQRTDYKLAYTLPEYAVVANKSGEMDEVENDVGIVYAPERDYIICVLSNGWKNNADAIETIQDISQTAYDFFNPDDSEYVMVKIGASEAPADGNSEGTETAPSETVEYKEVKVSEAEAEEASSPAAEYEIVVSGGE